MRDLENRLFLATAFDFPIVVGNAPDPGLARLVEFVHDNSIDVVITNRRAGKLAKLASSVAGGSR